MTVRYRAAVVGCGRMGATIDDQMAGRPDRGLWVPMSHAAAFNAVDRTSLVAVCSRRAERAEAARVRHGAPAAYASYRELIDRERPDILSVATRPASHCEIVLYGAEHGVRAIYCEKPLSVSMLEADEMLAACTEHGVRFNYGTQFAFMHVYRALREVIARGGIGTLTGVIAYTARSPAMWALPHTSHMLLMLTGEARPEYVQGTATFDPARYPDGVVDEDPQIVQGYVRFGGDVHGYIVTGPTTSTEFEVTGTDGVLRTMDNGTRVRWRRPGPVRPLTEDVPFPEVPQESGTVLLVQDLVRALDTGTETGSPLPLASKSQEIVLGLIESHRRDGARVPLPLENRSLTVCKPDW
jgi:predicted dehydrogenase